MKRIRALDSHFLSSPEVSLTNIKEDTILRGESDSKVTFRWLERTDYARGFPSVLAGLTKGCEYGEEKFLERFDSMFPREAHVYRIVVVVDNNTGRIIASGSLIIEKKFLRNAGLAGHIEDIVVQEGYKGQRLGQRLISVLKQIGWANNCYKVILDCNEKLVNFYEKCGFKKKGI